MSAFHKLKPHHQVVDLGTMIGFKKDPLKSRAVEHDKVLRSSRIVPQHDLVGLKSFSPLRFSCCGLSTTNLC